MCLPLPLGISTYVISISNELSSTNSSYDCKTCSISFESVYVESCATSINNIVYQNPTRDIGRTFELDPLVSINAMINELNTSCKVVKSFDKFRTYCS